VRRLLFGTSEAFYLDIRFKVLEFVADEVSGSLFMLEALLTIQIVCGTIGVIVMLGPRNPPHSWTGTWAPPLSG
jgi:hypothetical protein